jgi:hypothetical protein
MAIDYNTAGEQRSFDLIPDRTVVTVRMAIRTGDAGDGWLKRSKDGLSEALDCEFTVIDGPHTKRKFWERLLVAGTTPGHQEAADITGRKIRAILESARGIQPDDASETAKRGRQIAGYAELDGLAFMVRVGVEAAQGNYKAKNYILEIITPERAEWHRLEQQPAQGRAPSSSSGSPAFAAPATIAPPAPAAPAGRPSWAR